MKFQDLLNGFIRLHILYHATEHEIYGQWIIDELARHGYLEKQDAVEGRHTPG